MTFLLWKVHPLEQKLNLFKHQFNSSVRPRAMSDPIVAAARLQVTGLTCRLVGLLPATERHSDGPWVEHLVRLLNVCSLTRDGAHVLHEATQVNAGFKYTRVY